jgi:hypothetical protein
MNFAFSIIASSLAPLSSNSARVIFPTILVSDLGGVAMGNCALSFVALFPPPSSEINCFNLFCWSFVSFKWRSSRCLAFSIFVCFIRDCSRCIAAFSIAKASFKYKVGFCLDVSRFPFLEVERIFLLLVFFVERSICSYRCSSSNRGIMTPF